MGEEKIKLNSEISTQVPEASFNLLEKVTSKTKAFTLLKYVQRYICNEMKQNILNQILTSN